MKHMIIRTTSLSHNWNPVDKQFVSVRPDHGGDQNFHTEQSGC